jgi:hypothetical protein
MISGLPSGCDFGSRVGLFVWRVDCKLQRPGKKSMSLAHDVELARQKMLQAQEALLRYAEANDRDGERHKRLVQELKNATKDFVDRVERLARRASADE